MRGLIGPLVCWVRIGSVGVALLLLLVSCVGQPLSASTAPSANVGVASASPSSAAPSTQNVTSVVLALSDLAGPYRQTKEGSCLETAVGAVSCFERRFEAPQRTVTATVLAYGSAALADKHFWSMLVDLIGRGDLIAYPFSDWHGDQQIIAAGEKVRDNAVLLWQRGPLVGLTGFTLGTGEDPRLGVDWLVAQLRRAGPDPQVLPRLRSTRDPADIVLALRDLAPGAKQLEEGSGPCEYAGIKSCVGRVYSVPPYVLGSQVVVAPNEGDARRYFWGAIHDSVREGFSVLGHWFGPAVELDQTVFMRHPTSTDPTAVSYEVLWWRGNLGGSMVVTGRGLNDDLGAIVLAPLMRTQMTRATGS